MSRSRSWWAAALLAVAPLSLTLARTAPAMGADEPTITLLAQAPVTSLGTDFTFTVQGERIAPDTTLRTTIYERVVTRSGFDRTLDGRNLGATVARATTALPPGTATTIVTLPLAGSATAGTPLNITQTGVYPVRVELLPAGTGAQAVVSTYLVTAPADSPPVGEPLTVAAIVPVLSAPAFAPDGRPEPTAITERTPTGRLGRLADGLARNSATPITLDVGGETVSSWARLAIENRDLAASLNQLQRSATNADVVPAPFVPINAPSLRAEGLEPVVRDEYSAGFDAVTGALQVRADARSTILRTADEGTLELLGQRGIDQLVVDPGVLQPIAARLTPARPFLVNSADRQFRAITLDSGLGLAAASPGSVERAQRMLAGMALVALEAPNVRRGIAVMLPDNLDVPPSFYDTLLVGLRTSPFLRASTVDRMFEEIPLDATTAGPLVRSLAPTPLESATVTPAELERSRARAAALQSILGPTDPQVLRANNALLVAPTSLWTGTNGKRRASDELNGVDASLAEAARLVRAPMDRTFQLTGRKDRIPLTFVNDAAQPVRVRLIFEGSRIAFPEGTERIVELAPNKSTTVAVTVEPRTSGTYPFRLTMRTVEGDVQLATNQLTVNATAVSGVGLFLAGGAGLFLAAWWGHYVWKRRRRPAPPSPSPVSEPLEHTA